jgi:hypothetical protein
VDDQGVGGAVESSVAGDVGGAGPVGDQVVDGVDEGDSEPLEQVPERQIEVWLEAPLDMDHVRRTAGDSGQQQQPVQRVLAGFEGAAGGRAIDEAKSGGQRRAGQPKEVLMDGVLVGVAEILVEEARGS